MKNKSAFISVAVMCLSVFNCASTDYVKKMFIQDAYAHDFSNMSIVTLRNKLSTENSRCHSLEEIRNTDPSLGSEFESCKENVESMQKALDSKETEERLQTINTEHLEAQKSIETGKWVEAVEHCNKVLAISSGYPSCVDIQQKANIKIAEEQVAQAKLEEEKKKAETIEAAKRSKEDAIRARQMEIQSTADQICGWKEDLKQSKSYLESQKSASQQSGFVDKKAIHSMTLAIISIEKEISQSKIQYKKMTGKEFKNSMCQTAGE